MRSKYMFVVAVAICSPLVPTPGEASDPPAGSYLQSCTGVTASGSMIYAVQCKNRGNGYRYNQSFDSTGCLGEIANIDGTITCPKGSQPPPGGSYVQTCVQVETKFNTLYAKCKSKRNNDDISRWHYTSLPNVSACRNGVWNDDGNLRCQ
jgi:hypothetical protein